MPVIRFRDQTIQAEVGDRLRSVLLKAELSPHNGAARLANCKGFGTCGTCAVELEGEVDPPSSREKLRLGFPPHQVSSGLRLACMVKIKGDLSVKKHPGFWGEQVET